MHKYEEISIEIIKLSLEADIITASGSFDSKDDEIDADWR